MRTYAIASLIGDRSHQCDATAVHAAPGGVMAYAVLDGVGSSTLVQSWTRRAAGRVAQAAARHRDAEAGLRQVWEEYAAEPERQDWATMDDVPTAAALVAVAAPARPVTIAWSGDVRAYVLHQGKVECLTRDHNMRRVWTTGSRNVLTSCLGVCVTDAELMADVGHPTVEAASYPAEAGARLLLVTDGGYEPWELSCVDLAPLLGAGTPGETAARVVRGAVDRAGVVADNATALVVDRP